ncbi:MerR family transcriptional regulator [Pseudokineococcus lusitanus]|uniref:DNA-binding transcriptional MerR regulator n=1 Tax=Pseudokineococcus lusitanus TaxID=763993 RepID=A0A3N1GWM2_9ACTN|nr:MerR family transcriptional regulator [Pseudokineococcus lusitanus]ROP34637.1 DNA-binding transcriptional MerR regulator [Pseudokineococcus lusitanus]
MPPGLLQIGAVAERTGLSLHTLRHWDEVGLVPPSVRSDGGFRLYTEGDVERILLVRRMKPLGFSLEQMAGLLEVADALPGADGEEAAALRERLEEYRRLAEESRERMVRRVAMAEELVERLGALG